MANTTKNITFAGLGTFPFVLPETGIWNVEGKITLPTIPEGSPTNSQIVVTTNINGGGTLYTGVAGAEGFKTGGTATAGDTLNIILTSSAAPDQGLNVIKTTVSFY